MSTNIDFNADQKRYEITVDDTLAGFSEVQETDEEVTFTHTVVVDQFEGKGLAGELVTEALDDVRVRGKKVVPRCAYVKRFIDKHPEYANLLA